MTDDLEKTPEMLAEAQRMHETRSKSATVREKFAAGVEFAITMKKKHLHLGDVVEGVLAINELNRLRQLELNGELTPPPPTMNGEDPKAYLKQWNRVILQDDREEIDGAMMPVAYWYEDFMPKLLAAFSVCTADDIEKNTNPDEAALDQLYEETKAVGEFDRYGGDVCEEFPNCTPQQKLAILQAWRLSHHYLNGVQKRRERLEFGRECGALSQYVAFIDVWLNRSYVRDAQMRVSFPYYIGPGVWRFFHTSAEIVCTKSPEVQSKAQKKRTVDNLPVHSFQTLLADLGTIVNNRIQSNIPGVNFDFDKVTEPTPVQRKALDLLGVSLICTQ